MIRMIREKISNASFKNLEYVKDGIDQSRSTNGDKIFNTELKSVMNGNHYILKITSDSMSSNKIIDYLNYNFKFGLTGNGLKYKEMRNNEVWVYAWDLEIDKKWSNIWKEKNFTVYSKSKSGGRDKVGAFDDVKDVNKAIKDFRAKNPGIEVWYENLKERNDPDLRARIIASEWYDGMNDPLYALVSTGAIIDGVEESIMNQVGDPKDRDFLMDYVLQNGERGPQAGWENLRW